MPEAAERIIRTTLATDAGVRAALARLEDIAGRFDRLEEQNRRLLGGQDEMLALLRRTLGLAAFVEELRGAPGRRAFSTVVAANLAAGPYFLTRPRSPDFQPLSGASTTRSPIEGGKAPARRPGTTGLV
jgi:hypothetical protein